MDGEFAAFIILTDSFVDLLLNHAVPPEVKFVFHNQINSQHYLLIINWLPPSLYVSYMKSLSGASGSNRRRLEMATVEGMSRRPTQMSSSAAITAFVVTS